MTCAGSAPGEEGVPVDVADGDAEPVDADAADADEGCVAAAEDCGPEEPEPILEFMKWKTSDSKFDSHPFIQSDLMSRGGILSSHPSQNAFDASMPNPSPLANSQVSLDGSQPLTMASLTAFE